jgi:hypothetical protein
MADNVSITSGSGTSIAADEVSSVYYQRVKVSHGADGSATDTSSAAPLPVDAGQSHMIRVAPTVTAGAYAADDCMGGEMTLENAARNANTGGVLHAITMVAEDDSADTWSASDVEVMIFDTNPAGTYTDNIALDSSALTDADAFLLVGSFVLNTKIDLGNVTMLKATGLSHPYTCNGANLYAVAINRGATTPEAADSIQFTFHLVRD